MKQFFTALLILAAGTFIASRGPVPGVADCTSVCTTETIKATVTEEYTDAGVFTRIRGFLSLPGKISVLGISTTTEVNYREEAEAESFHSGVVSPFRSLLHH